MREAHISTQDGDAIATRIRELRIAHKGVDMKERQTVVTGVVDDGVLDANLLRINAATITQNAVVATMDVGKVHEVTITLLGKADAAPLTGDAVVRLIGKHIAQSVTTEDYIFLGTAQHNKATIHKE